uniref:Uncharacterized protein n=1 Tax=Arundo donax TaxID=35708 RepID=A0A0A9E461_ARUDO
MDRISAIIFLNSSLSIIPLWSTSNILKAALKLDSGMLSNVTKKMYSAKEMRPSLFVSNSMKNFDGAQCNSPGLRSPLNLPSRTMVDSDGGKTGTTALIKSAGNM